MSNVNRAPAQFEMTESPPRSVVRDRDIDQSTVDLDDHRLQPASLPRTEYSPRTRRGTLASIYDSRPDLLQVDAALRDSEQAIVESDSDMLPSPADGKELAFGPVSPGVARKKSRPNRRNKAHVNVSRDSSSSKSTSPSPPNSVHAFAESSRRRERAGTVNSKCPSINDLELHRTHSRESNYSRRSRRSRRPTFSGRSVDDKRGDESGHSSAEDDVCYPQSESGGSDEHSIDFSDLEEFVQEEEEARELSTAVPAINLEAPTPDRPLSAQATVEDDFDDLEKAHTSRLNAVPVDSRSIKANVVRPFWTFFSSELDDTIHATTIGGLLEEGETFRQLFEISPDGGCWWLDAVNPTEDEVAALCKAFSVHPLTREDIITQESREKVELFKKYYFVSFQSFDRADKASEDYLEPLNVYAVVFRHGLLTFSFSQNPHTANVLKRIGRLRDYMALSADWICYALIDDIVDSYIPVIRDVEEEADNIEDQILAARPEDARPILQAIAGCRKKSMMLMRLLNIKPDVIKGFAKRCNEGFSVAPRGDVGLYLSDIQDHVVTMRDNLSHSEQILSRLHNNFLAQINVDNISSGNRVNKILSKVTVVATIIVPMNIITGLWGTNVNVPGKNASGLGWFFGIVGFLVLYGLVVMIVARRMRLF